MGYKTDWFKGIFPALVTPFTSDSRFDEAAYRALIRHVLPHVNGVVPCGTTGEFSYMSFEERKQVIEVCLDEVNDRVPVLAGTGMPSTRETLALTEWARDAGVSGALVVAPYYLKPSFNEVYDHYRALDKLGLPLVLYFNAHIDGNPEFRQWAVRNPNNWFILFSEKWPFEAQSLHSPFRSKAVGQVRELLAGYGRVDGLWLDVFRQELNVRSECVVNAFEEMMDARWRKATPEQLDEFHVRTLAGFLDEVRAIAQEITRGNAWKRVHFALDFFDASINRVAAWVIGSRAALKAVLLSLLEPVEMLQEFERTGDLTSRLAYMEEMKSLPFSAVWDRYCVNSGAPVGTAWMDEVKRYEAEVLSARK